MEAWKNKGKNADICDKRVIIFPEKRGGDIF